MEPNRTGKAAFGLDDATFGTIDPRRTKRQIEPMFVPESEKEKLIFYTSYGKVFMETDTTKNFAMSNEDTRKWYIAQDKRIPDLIDRELPLEDQARQACELRNAIRTKARDLMADQETGKALDISDPNLSFEERIIAKMNRKHLSRDEAIRDILKTATKINERVNAQFGLEG